jgi:3-hydroxyacyl-[acyl-carrier-protein] dehydratase
MKFSQRLNFPPDHPALAGHFPDDPVVPAVVILDAVRDVVESQRTGTLVSGIKHAKFQAVLRPGREVELEIQSSTTGFEFRCLVGADIIASGELIVDGEI